MKKFNHLKIFVLCVLLSVFHSCKDDPSEFKINPEFRKYISAFTSGVVSAKTPIKITLTKPYDKKIKPNQAVKSDLFSISPAVKGKTVWVDQYTVEFIPNKALESGETYWITFNLGKIMKVPDEFETFKFPITIVQQALNFENGGLKSYSESSMKYYQYKGKMYTVDFISTKALSKLVTVTVNGKKRKTKWQQDGNQPIYNLVVDSVLRTKVEGKIEVKWNTKPYNDGEDLTVHQKIPALGDFKVINTTVTQAPEQMITVQFSDPLLSRQELLGLVEIKGVELKTTTSTNELMIYPQRHLEGEYTLILHKAIKNAEGFAYNKLKWIPIAFHAIKPAVKFVGEGNILPSSNKMVIPFEAVNLKAVDVKIIKIFKNNVQQFFQNNDYGGDRNLKRVGRVIRKKTIYLGKNKPLDLKKWNRFNLDLSQYIEVDQNAIYRVVLSFRKYQSLYPCSGSLDENVQADNTNWDMKAEKSAEGWAYQSDWNGDYYDNYYFSGYDYSERENPCSYSYYSGKSIAKNVFASDIGIIAKMGTNSKLTAIVTNIVTAEPIENATVKVYDYQQQLIATLKTDENGIAESKKLPFEPFFIAVENQKQKGYLRLGDGNNLPLSSFDIGGQTIKDGIKGFIYGERGVWRPGDTLFLNFILEDKENAIPDNHPVIFELFNARGQLVRRKVKTYGLNGFYNFTTATSANAPTGNWLVKVEVGGATFTKTIKIETIKPNRLKIDLKVNNELLSPNSNIEGTLNVEWLHGAPARGLKTDVSYKFFMTETKFKGFENYYFGDFSANFYSVKEPFLESNLNHEGMLSFSKKIEVNSQAPGMLDLVFTTRAYEPGGNFSIDRKAFKYSPYEYYVGMNFPETNSYGALQTGKTYSIPLITLNQLGKRAGNRKLEIQIYQIDWSWWWENGVNNVASYVNRYDVVPYSTSFITSNQKGEATASINIPKYDWGRYYIKITDVESKHSCSLMSYFDWPSWMSRAGRKSPENANVLVFSSDKKSYNPGETAKISFPSAKGGKALVSIENGKKVMQTFWVEAQSSETQFEVPITPELAPNCYVHITFVQPHKHTKNDAPIRMYGVIPLLVENPKTVLHPEIDMPKVLRPNADFTVKISEKNNKPMTYTIAVVDEGLLSLTNFKTPNPWDYFYAREALGVKTWDLYNYVIGAYGAKVENILTIGGDGSINPGEKKPIRFKPMVRFLGPFELKAGASAKHKIHVPNYIGAVRTMVVAGQNGAYGNAEETTPVRTPLMVLATLPRVLGPQETVQLPVNLFAMEKNVKNVSVRIKTNDKVSVVGSATQQIYFSETGNKVVNFKLKVGTKIGTAKVEVIATSGNEKSTQTIELEVRQPNLPVTVSSDESIAANSSWEGTLNLPGMDRSNSAVLELSVIPPINLEQRLGYLTRYPHGCIEQKTSGAFPQLYLSNLIDVDAKMKQKIENNIRSVINRIQRHQLSSGGFSYWEGGNYVSDWGTSYAGNFLLEAEKKGYALPYGLKEKWINFQKSEARAWSSTNQKYYYRRSDLSQAYRLYTLALAGEPVLSAMNRLRHLSTLSTQAAWRLAAAYQIMGKSSVAKSIVNGKATQVSPYTELSNTFGNQYRDEAMIIETLTLMGQKLKAAPLVKNLSKVLSSSDWMSTQTNAYALLSIAKFVENNQPTGGISATYTYHGKTHTINSRKAVEMIELPVWSTQKIAEIQVNNKADNILFARLVGTGTPLAGNEVSASNNINLNVVYRNTNDQIINVNEIQQGMDFYAEVTVSNPGMRGDYENLVLTQIFPSGWEIQNQRMELGSSFPNNVAFTYQDIRDDRVYTYFNLRSNRKKVFRINLHASFVGDYYLPAVRAEAMYDNSISALVKGNKVKVVMAGE